MTFHEVGLVVRERPIGKLDSSARFAWETRAIAFIDVFESVRLIEEDEGGTVGRWLALVDQVKERLLPTCGGTFVKNLGDGMLVTFADARSAVMAAFAIQHLSMQLSSTYPDDHKIFVRIGIELSDIIVEKGDLYGHGVNVAARLLKLAGPGEIIVSARVKDRLTDTLDADIEDLGDCYLRHLQGPVRAYRIGPPGPHPVISRSAATDPLAPTLAVVPFSPHGKPQDDPGLGDVLAEEVIRTLAHCPELNVISRLSTSAFSGRSAALEEIMAHLRADYVVTGGYSCDDRNISLALEMAEAKSGRIVVAQTFQDRLASIVGGEQELIGRIVAEIGRGVMLHELQRSQSQPLPTLKGYTLLIAAVAMMHRLSLQDFEAARHLLQTLIDRRPRQAIPQAWLAKWHVLRLQQGWSLNQQHDTSLALDCTKRALDADPNCTLALAMDGLVHTHMLKRLEVAQERYEAAIEGSPSDPLSWLLKGTLHAFRGEGGQAVHDTQRALRLTPLDPHRWYYDSLAATACLADHDFEGALALAQRSLRANRTHTSTLRAQAIAQWQLGREEDARETARQLLQREPHLTVRSWLERSPSAPFRIGAEWAEVLRQVGVPH